MSNDTPPTPADDSVIFSVGGITIRTSTLKILRDILIAAGVLYAAVTGHNANQSAKNAAGHAAAASVQSADNADKISKIGAKVGANGAQ